MSRLGNFSLILGLLLGFAAGLFYSWTINPVEYIDSSPDSLREDFKSDYLTLIASAYVATGDADRARARLAWVQIIDPASTLGRMAQSRLAMTAERPLRCTAQARTATTVATIRLLMVA